MSIVDSRQVSGLLLRSSCNFRVPRCFRAAVLALNKGGTDDVDCRIQAGIRITLVEAGTNH